jgi:hypothetical protein
LLRERPPGRIRGSAVDGGTAGDDVGEGVTMLPVEQARHLRAREVPQLQGVRIVGAEATGRTQFLGGVEPDGRCRGERAQSLGGVEPDGRSYSAVSRRAGASSASASRLAGGSSAGRPGGRRGQGLSGVGPSLAWWTSKA